MSSFNKVILMGNLTRDPEMRVTPNGMAICKIGLAVNRQFTTQDGERREEVTFVDIDAFGRQAEVIAKYMSKGRPILIEGRLRLDQWETPQGDKRSKLGVVCENFQFVGGREDGGGSPREGAGDDRAAPASRSGGSRSGNSENSGSASGGSGSDKLDDDDVPF